MTLKLSRRRLLAGSLLTLSLLFTACTDEDATAGSGDRSQSTPATWDHSTDLVGLLPFAETLGETGRIPLESPIARWHLSEGWSSAEPHVWGLGERFVLRFLVWEPRPLTLRLVGLPFAYEGAPQQTLEVVLNGVPLQRLDVRPGGQEYRIALPPESLRSGENLVELLYGNHRRPLDVFPASEDGRDLAVAWSEIELEGTGPPGRESHADPERPDALVLTNGSVVRYHVWWAGGGQLTLEAASPWSPDGDTRARPDGAGLVVESRAAGSPDFARVEFDVSDLRSGAVLDIPPSPQGPLLLSLRARPGEGPESGDGLRLLRPRLLSPEPVFGEGDRPIESDEPERRPDIVIYLADTLRADRLGCYGYPLDTSPHIDAFAADATLFEMPVAQTSWTRGAVASLFTGLYAQTHGTNGREDGLASSVPLMPEVLAALGYQTSSILTNGNVSRAFGFDRGFESYVYLREDGETEPMHVLSDVVNEEVGKWLDGRDESRPCFLYVHTTDPHSPYKPQAPYRERFAPHVDDPVTGTLDQIRGIGQLDVPTQERLAADMSALYDAEIAQNDEHFGAFLDDLRRRGIYDSAIIVFLSDHGEEFLDHAGWQHGRTLFAEQLRVPFIVRLPGGVGAGRRISAPARQIDILPTLLDYLGQPRPPALQGHSLLPLMRGQSIVEAPQYAYLQLDGQEIEMVQLARKKLIQTRGMLTLYDVGVDPGETRSLVHELPVWTGYLTALLSSRESEWAAQAPTAEAELDEDTRRTLEALGYLR